MNQIMQKSLLKRLIPQVLTWTGLVVLSGVIAVAQEPSSAANSDSAATQSAGQRSDGQIEMDVVHALDASKALKNDLITAATIQSEVTLSGTVASASSSELAESIAARVAGVTKVHNNLKVGNSQDAQAAAQVPDSTDPGAQQMADNQPSTGQASTGQASAGQASAGQVQPDAGQDQGQAAYPDQGQAAYPPARPQYAPQQQAQYAPPPAPAYEAPKGPVTIPQGTLLQLRTSEALSSKRAKDGEPVQFTVISDVAFGGVLAIPRGATVHGVVSEVKKVGSGNLAGSSELALQLTSLDLGGQSYPLNTDEFKVKGPNKAGQTVSSAVGGGIIGAIIGCAAGRGAGCAIGAGAGVAAGTAASAASSGPGVWIPAEALVTFHLSTPLTVTPVNAQEAARLAQGLYTGGPSLYRRGYYPYGSPYVAVGYPYGYPPVYYRPYYVSGGYYYWQ